MNIYVPKLASPVEQTGAGELATWLKKATGEDFPILTEGDASGDTTGIYVGYTELAAANNIKAEGGRNSLEGVEAWVIRAVGNKLVITGGRKNTDRGVIYAVEHYLEDVAGFRFWNGIEEYVPTIENFSIDPTTNLSGEPELEMRSAVSNTFPTEEPIPSVRHRQNNRRIDDAWGGYFGTSSVGGCHTINRILPKSNLQFEQHPDWYAWNEQLNKRIQYGQYCLNNEEFLAEFEKAFLQHIADSYADADASGKPRPHHFHISMEDTPHDCQCPKCKEVIAKSGGTGNVLRFVNRMAEAAAKVYPQVLVETLVYWTYMELPLDDTVPAKNVIVRLADLEIDILHSLTHPNNAHMLEVLKGWSDICKKGGNPLAIWDYNCGYTMTPVSNIYRMAENFRIYADCGVIGQFVEHQGVFLFDFWCLKYWLLIHLMEDSRADTNALIADFLDKYYGPAAPYLYQWIQLTEEISAKSMLRMRCVECYTKADHITYDAVIAGNRLFDQAEEAVLYDKTYTRRVRQARAALDVASTLRYDTLLYVAQRRGETLAFTRETPALRYALTVQETLDWSRRMHPGGAPLSWEGEKIMPYLQLPHKPAPLPEQFAHTDTLAVPMHDYLFYGSNGSNVVFVRDPDAAVGYTMQCPLATAGAARRDALAMFKRGTKNPHFNFTLRHNGAMLKREFYLDEITPDKYALYHLFDMDDLSEGSNTLLRFIFTSMHLSGFARDLPTGKVSLWASIKYSGAAYGGDENTPSAFSIDRLFLVPRN